MPGRLSSIRTGLIILILLAAIPAIALSLYNAADRRQQDGAAAQREALSLLGLISAEQEQLIAETRGFLHFLSR